MAITKNSGRQHVQSAYVDFALADLAVGANSAIDLPIGAVIVGGDLVITQAFNSTTSDTIAVGDVTTANRYLTATNVQATGRTPLVPTGFNVTNSQPSVNITWASGGGTPTTGAGRLRVDYYVNKRASHAQG